VHLRDVDEVGVGVVLQVRVEPVRDRALADAGLHDRVAVGRRARAALGADHAAGAAEVLDQHRLLQHLAELLGDHPAHHVAGAARRERHDQPDRPGRPVGLRVRGRGQRRGEGGQGERVRQSSAVHRVSSGGRRSERRW
jgi:hypothetical protein